MPKEIIQFLKLKTFISNMEINLMNIYGSFGLISCTENPIAGQLLEDVTATASLSFLSLLTESIGLVGGPLPALWPWPPATGSSACESGVGLCEGHICCRPTSALGPGSTHTTGLDLQVKAPLCFI